MSLLLLNQKKQSIQSEFNQPLSKFKPRIIKGDNGINSNAIELAENQAIISKERDENKKITIENFEKKLKTRAKLVEKENKSIRESQFLQKLNEKTRFLNVSKEYAEKSLNSFKKKAKNPENPPQILQELNLPLKAEIIYPIMQEDPDEIDERSLKTISETIQEYSTLREKLNKFTLFK